MLSNSTKYAIKAVLYLALKSDLHNKVLAKDVAKGINGPPQYVSKLLQMLSRQHLITSTKGRGGGFYLTEKNLDQPLIRIVAAIDGEDRLHACVLDLERCNLESPCPMHDVIYPTKSKLLEFLDTESVKTFTEKYQAESNYFERKTAAYQK